MREIGCSVAPHRRPLINPSRHQSSLADSYDTYSAQFLTRDFVSLIEDMGDIESKIRQDLHLALLALLANRGGTVRGDVIEIDGDPHKLLVTSPMGGRTLHVLLADLAGNETLETITVPIDGFGLVKEVHLEFPPSRSHVHNLSVEIVSSHFRRAYMSLQAAYVETYGQWVASLFSTAYGIINTELLVKGDIPLKDRFWFSVTDLDRLTFRYHFSRENLASTVEWLRRNQDHFLSPCAAATLLITEDVADGVIGVPETTRTTQYDENTVIVEFAGLPTLGVNTAFWVAERTLFENEALAAIHVHEIDGRAVELNCAADSVEVFATIIGNCREDLVNVVGRSYEDFKRQQRKLHDAVERARSSVSWLRETGTDFAAKVMAELIRPS
ncbi:MAG TPA: hypothetical protein VNM41_08140 [Solirubrobacterales bacterium]|nr:hypothetical protein [Solirubrobacterales bacterium]